MINKTTTITGAVRALVASLDALTPEQQVHAAAAVRLAQLMDSDDLAPYVLAGLTRELRAVVAALAGGPVAGQGVPEAELDALLRGTW